MSALNGVRILDFSRVLAGPYCAQVLGDYGAEVIKVELPGLGDGTRQWGPPWVGGQSAYYLSANRNKRSLTLDLKSPEGMVIARKLIEHSDVLIENFLPGTMDSLGLGFEAIHALNPRLVYCSISGYGQTGPYRDEPGYDAMIQAQSGWMSVTGSADGEPHKVGVALVDVIAGLFASNAILAALHHREHSGVGQHIDVALFDAALAALVNVAHNALATGAAPQRHGNAHPNIVPYQTFASSDGHIMLAVGTDAQFRRLCDVLERDDLKADPRFATNPLRVRHRDVLIPLLADVFLRRTTRDWLERIKPAGIPVSAINDVLTALNDPQTQAREMVQSVGDVALLGPVAKLSVTAAVIRSAPPRLGEHTDAILSELGYTAEHIRALRYNKVT